MWIRCSKDENVSINPDGISLETWWRPLHLEMTSDTIKSLSSSQQKAELQLQFLRSFSSLVLPRFSFFNSFPWDPQCKISLWSFSRRRPLCPCPNKTLTFSLPPSSSNPSSNGGLQALQTCYFSSLLPPCFPSILELFSFQFYHFFVPPSNLFPVSIHRSSASPRGIPSCLVAAASVPF